MIHVDASQTILVVDDSDDDFDATVRALTQEDTLQNPIRRCENGQDALDYLHRRGDYAAPEAAPRPGIILLDLNMPGIDGRRVLEEISKDPELKRIPIIVLTNSSDDRDISACYAMGANTYIQKPLNWDRFFNVMARLKEYWFGIAVLPKP